MVATGNVVKDFYIGNTRVRICDDYCKGKTTKEVETILRRIAQMAIEPLRYKKGEQTSPDGCGQQRGWKEKD